MEKVLFTTLIDDYDQLRKDYEDWCEEMGQEPEKDGEFQFHHNNVELVWDVFKYQMKKLDKGHPYNFFLCVGSCGFWNGRAEGGIVSDSIVELVDNLSEHVDDVTFSLNDNGQIEFCGMHHDGRDYYTITMLNLRANKIIEKALYEHGYCKDELVGNRELNEKLDRKFYAKKISENDVDLC